jgi:ABC-type transport system involved in multi-copper enzyme maturation permease subunit
MMVREVFRFEVGYRLRQPSTWVYAAVLVGVPFLMLHALTGSRLFLNAPEAVLRTSGILGNIGLLVSAGVVGDAATRDVHSRMHALFYTSPLRERDYVLGRFLGAAAVTAVLLLGIPLGLLLASVMPYAPAGKFGPTRPAAYVQAYVLVLLPNLVLMGACMFAAAALARRALAAYAGGVVLYVLGTLAERLTDGGSNATLSALADPFGGAATRAVTRLWTPSELNAQLLGWPEIVLWNRALWLAVTLAVLGGVATRFRFAHPVRAHGRSWPRPRRVIDTAPDRVAPIDGPGARDAGRSFSSAARARQTLAVAAHAWREIAATRAVLLVLAGALVFVFAFGWDVGAQVFGTSTWPVTHLVAGTVLSAALGPVMAVLVAVVAGELVWRERDAGMGDIADAAPVPNGVVLLGRFLAIVAVLVALQAVLAGAGVLLQALRGWHRHEPLVYLKLLFGVKLVDYVLLAVLAMAVHVVANNKYVGHLVVVLGFAFTQAAGLLGVHHRMLIYGSDPGWGWSDMNGLAPYLAGLVWFKLYWAAWALLLAALASLFWVRGRERGARRRLALARQRLGGPARRAVAAAGTLILSLGGFVFYNTNVVNAYASNTPDAVASRRAEYERRYKRYEGMPQPTLSAARLRIELYPEERAAEIRGTYRFVNRTGRPVDSLHVLLNHRADRDVETRAVGFDRASRVVVDDRPLRYRVYALERPLAPGDSVAMTFEVAFRPRGFRNAGAPTEVTSNGTLFDRTWLPMLGYQARLEVADEQTRRELRLPPRAQAPSAGDEEAEARGDRARGLVSVDAETVIGTDPRQIAITPGTLVREWRERGRRYFRYRIETTPRWAGAVLAGEYAVRQARWNGVRLRVYHHPTHDVNVGRMLRSMQASLAYYSAHFGSYPARELSVVESAGDGGARAHPHMIAFSEGSAFLTRVDPGDVDRTFLVVAHETAHQWWGGQVVPAGARGAAVVNETLSQYSAMMALEATYGPEMARRLYGYYMDMYLSSRGVYTNREAPLLDVERQKYVYYFKGAVAMYALREALGAGAVNGALRRFRERYAGPDAPPATALALYAELQAVTPDSLRPLLSDLFEHITLWDVRTDSARTEPAGGGAYRVTLHVTASKARADSVGRQTPTAMDDLVEVGVFAGRAGGERGPGEPLYLARHRVRGGRQTIAVTVPRAPARAGVDPYHGLIERERDDNVAAVGGDTTRGGGR